MAYDQWQAAVIAHRQGTARCEAVPGSGKTSTLVAHVRQLLVEGTDPHEILILSFSRPAARALYSRLRSSGVRGAQAVTVRTFHSHASTLLGAATGARARPREILAQQHVLSLYYEVLGPPTAACPEAIGPLAVDVAEMAGVLERIRLTGRDHSGLARSEVAAARAYEKLKRRRGLMDYTDLIEQAVAVLGDAGCAGRIWWPAVLLVDEAQDTNRLQLAMVKRLAARARHVLIVGDPKQAIYGFQGADSEALTRLDEHFGALTTYRLPVSYRCSLSVARTANALMRRFADPDLVEDILPASSERGHVVTIGHTDATDEIGWVADQATDLAETGRSVLVLARTNFDLEPVGVALQRRHTAYTRIGSREGFWQLPEVDGLLDMARLAHDPTNLLAGCRLSVWPAPRRRNFTGDARLVLGAGGAPDGYQALAGLPGRQERVHLLLEPALRAASQMSPAALYGPLAYGAWRQFLPSYLAGRAEDTVPPFLLATMCARSLDQLLAQASYRPEHQHDQRVMLATAHGAKGMEADVVIVVGTEEGRFPHHRAISEAEQAEELRLLYVAITRARQEVCLSWAATRGSRQRVISPWVDWLIEDLDLPTMRTARLVTWLPPR
jgi:DNA helicase-2/ATP-dependent DNA helicase PcrA